MLIYPDKVEERGDVCSVWLIVAGCCHYLAATLHLTPGGFCLRACVRPCVCVCVCSLARPPRAVPLSEDATATVKLLVFVWKLFHQGGWENAALFPLAASASSLLACVRVYMCARARVAWPAAYVWDALVSAQTSPARFSHILCFTQLISALLRELISRALIPARPLAGCVDVPRGPLSAPIDWI